MKKILKVLSLLITTTTIFCVAGCGNQGNVNSDSNQTVESNVVSSEDYFEWNENIIVALTEDGAKQENLVIPERCEGFAKVHLFSGEVKVTSVSFESDKDIDLNGVFQLSHTLQTITLPAQLSEIGDLEFWDCISLEEITIPASVTSIGDFAFQGADSLKEVSIEGNTSILAYAFMECDSLETVNFSDDITFIDEYAFNGCKALKEVRLPASLSEIGKYAFANSGLESLTIPETLELSQYDTTSFIQADHDVTVNVTEGSWMDQNFDAVFDSSVFIKNYN